MHIYRMHWVIFEEFNQTELNLGFKNWSCKLELLDLSWVIVVIFTILLYWVGFILFVSSKKYISIEDIKYTPNIDLSKQLFN